MLLVNQFKAPKLINISLYLVLLYYKLVNKLKT